MACECLDGVWRFTGFDALPDIGRKVRLPLYKFCGGPDMVVPYSIIADQEPDPQGNRYLGRVIVDWCPEGVATEAQLANFGPTDVVQWPLYHGGPHPATRGAGLGARLPAYDSNLALLAELCQRVPGIGILLGNCGGELAYHHLLCAPDQRQREWCIEQDVRFIRETGRLVRAAGGRPFWGPMEREVLIDCYHGGGRMGRTVAEFGGAMIVFQEGGLFPRWTMIYGVPAGEDHKGSDGRILDVTDAEGNVIGEVRHDDLPQWRDDYGIFVDRDHREPYPYPTLLAYFAEFEVWHCIGYSQHFLAGYDNLLAHHGVKVCVY